MQPTACSESHINTDGCGIHDHEHSLPSKDQHIDPSDYCHPYPDVFIPRPKYVYKSIADGYANAATAADDLAFRHRDLNTIHITVIISAGQYFYLVDVHHQQFAATVIFHLSSRDDAVKAFYSFFFQSIDFSVTVLVLGIPGPVSTHRRSREAFAESGDEGGDGHCRYHSHRGTGCARLLAAQKDRAETEDCSVLGRACR